MSNPHKKRNLIAELRKVVEEIEQLNNELKPCPGTTYTESKCHNCGAYRMPKKFDQIKCLKSSSSPAAKCLSRKHRYNFDDDRYSSLQKAEACNYQLSNDRVRLRSTPKKFNQMTSLNPIPTHYYETPSAARQHFVICYPPSVTQPCVSVAEISPPLLPPQPYSIMRSPSIEIQRSVYTAPCSNNSNRQRSDDCPSKKSRKYLKHVDEPFLYPNQILMDNPVYKSPCQLPSTYLTSLPLRSTAKDENY